MSEMSSRKKALHGLDGDPSEHIGAKSDRRTSGDVQELSVIHVFVTTGGTGPWAGCRASVAARTSRLCK